MPLRFEDRQNLFTAWKIVETDGTVRYYVTPEKLLVYGGSPGVEGYVWSTPIGGRPPPFGIVIDSLTGVLHWSGSPLSPPGVYYFDLEVTDGSSTATRTFTIEVKEY